LAGGWFEDPSRITPEQLLTVKFPLAGRGHRGYEEDAVRKLLGDVHGEFERLVKERTDLWQEVQRLRQRIIAGNTNGESRALALDQVDPCADTVPTQITPQAQMYADLILDHTRTQAREAAVSALDAASAPAPGRERQAAQAELAYMRTYSDVCRAHLRAYTEGILRGIDEWERNESASLQDAAQGRPPDLTTEIEDTAYLNQ